MGKECSRNKIQWKHPVIIGKQEIIHEYQCAIRFDFNEEIAPLNKIVTTKDLF